MLPETVGDIRVLVAAMVRDEKTLLKSPGQLKAYDLTDKTGALSRIAYAIHSAHTQGISDGQALPMYTGDKFADHLVCLAERVLIEIVWPRLRVAVPDWFIVRQSERAALLDRRAGDALAVGSPSPDDLVAVCLDAWTRAFQINHTARQLPPEVHGLMCMELRRWILLAVKTGASGTVAPAPPGVMPDHIARVLANEPLHRIELAADLFLRASLPDYIQRGFAVGQRLHQPDLASRDPGLDVMEYDWAAHAIRSVTVAEVAVRKLMAGYAVLGFGEPTSARLHPFNSAESSALAAAQLLAENTVVVVGSDNGDNETCAGDIRRRLRPVLDAHDENHPSFYLGNTIVDAYLGLLCARARRHVVSSTDSRGRHPARTVLCTALPCTFFYKLTQTHLHNPQLDGYDYASAARLFNGKQRDNGYPSGERLLRDYEVVIVPCHLHGNHFAVAMVYFRLGYVFYYDPSGNTSPEVPKKILRFFENLATEQRIPLKRDLFVVLPVTAPWQLNAVDCTYTAYACVATCGVFTVCCVRVACVCVQVACSCWPSWSGCSTACQLTNYDRRS